jgi:hypothetical protein
MSRRSYLFCSLFILQNINTNLLNIVHTTVVTICIPSSAKLQILFQSSISDLVPGSNISPEFVDIINITSVQPLLSFSRDEIPLFSSNMLIHT